MADSLSQLQEVDTELAATSGRRSPGVARAFYLPEVHLALARTCVGRSTEILVHFESYEKQPLMITKGKLNGNGLTGVANEGAWPGIDSRFRLIIVAGLRTKQLLHGSKPRIEADKARRRNTSIAVEEVKRGLVNFTKIEKPEVHRGHGGGLD